MSAPALTLPQRRGACPGLSAPMPTGDGLLVRLLPVRTIGLDAFGEMCAAARRHGNGIVEITSRGSIQIRGLSAVSAPRFASAIAALGIAAEDGIPVLSDPLAGLEADAPVDAGALAADVRRALVHSGLAQRLSAKVSVIVDGGSTLNLDPLAADVRLRAEAGDSGAILAAGIGGDGNSASDLGFIALHDAGTAVVRLLETLVQHRRDARARDVVAKHGTAAFRAAIVDLLLNMDAKRRPRRARDPVGVHRLRDGLLACGIGLAFGHADAASLQRLADAAAAAGADGVRAAPSRVLLTTGLAPQALPSFVMDAEALGFVVRADDPRRNVIACAGAPICAAANIAARAMAPQIAAAIAPYRDRPLTIHVSGCAKGCAHPAPAALTVVGTAAGCALIAGGTARDAPFNIVAADALPAAVATRARDLGSESCYV
jgi:precorrin-3B synthase